MAFVIYLGLSLFFFGRGLIGHFGDRYIGVGQDPANVMYHLVWWPYAISHRINLLIARFVWVPDGVNLAKVPSMPLAALLVAPVTMMGGPVRGLNSLLLSLPILSALAAFTLYRKFCGNFWPSIAGGYIFGFSPFMLGHILGQPHLIAGALVVFAVYLTLTRLNCEISARRFAILMTLVLFGQFGFSLEVLASGSLFGGAALALSWLMADTPLRRRIIGIVPPLACAYAATVLIASPYLLFFLRGQPINLPPQLSINLSSDPLNFIIPTRLNELGVWTDRFLAPRANLWEATAYMSVPELVIVGMIAWRRWKSFSVRLCVWMLFIVAIFSLGPILVVGMHAACIAPEIILYVLVPLFRNAMPCRFTMFLFIPLGALFAYWLDDGSLYLGTRIALGALALLSLLPNLNLAFWTTPVDIPPFFKRNEFRNYISKGENVLVMPYGAYGNSDLWQARNDFYFNMTGGYLGIDPPVPESYAKWPIVQALYGIRTIPGLARQMAAFLFNKRVTKIIVPDEGAHIWVWNYTNGPGTQRLRPFTRDEDEVISRFFSPFDSAPIHVGGVTIYRVSLDQLTAYAKFRPAELQIEAARSQLEALITAGNGYIERYGSTAGLTLEQTVRLGLLPRLWITGPARSGYPPDPSDMNGLVLGVSDHGWVHVGLSGSRSALEQLRKEYHPYWHAEQLRGSSVEPNLGAWSLSKLTLDFDREGLAKAAAYAAHQEASAAANASEAREKGAFAGVHD